jgi:hypothetical protein
MLLSILSKRECDVVSLPENGAEMIQMEYKTETDG